MSRFSLSTLQELKVLVVLTGPILISQFAQAGYGLIDTLMAGQLSPLDLAAVALGASIWLPLYLLTTGTLLATTALVSEARGAGQLAQIPRITHQALWLAAIVGMTGLLLIQASPPILSWMGMPTHLHALTADYLYGVSWGMPAVAFFFVLRCYCEAQAKPLPITLISVLGLGLNVLANRFFMYGHEDFFGWTVPAMGGAGCGWGTAVVMWTMTLVLLTYVLLTKAFSATRLLTVWSPPHGREILRIAKLGLPIGLAIFFEVSSFALVAILVSPSGEIAVAGHQIALSVTSVIFMLPLSLALALTIRCGHHFGAQDLAALQLTRRVGLTATTLMACGTALMLLLLREPIVQLYSTDPAVIDLATQLLLFAVAYQIADALQVGAAGCLRGLQDTRSPMQLTLLAYWGVGIPFGYVAGSTDWLGQAWGAQGYWAGLVLGLTVAAWLLNRRLRYRLNHLAFNTQPFRN
mgnify:FL=1